MRRTLTVKHDIPIILESRLIRKYGYYVQQHRFKEAIIFGKMAINKDKPIVTDEDYAKIVTGLSKAEEEALITRCDRIVDYFVDPYNTMREVRNRLNNFRRTLKTAPEQQYVLEYMDENFPEGSY